MPPYELWLRGHESIARWLTTFGIGCRGSRILPVEACGGTPAFAQWRDGGATPWALVLLELEGDRITSMTSYLDVETLFPRFGVPLQLTS
jgi:RNA polymerase sigma-70 factor (ECF subfamily)